MQTRQLSTLRHFSLLFLLPGLVGMIFAAMLSTHYLDTMPRTPEPDEMRMTPRNIHGAIVYQTTEEDRKLTLVEDLSVACLVVGLGMGLVYLEKWGSLQARTAE